MKLSEAIMLGDSLRARTNSTFLDMDTIPPCGCALGGAQLAVGRTEFMEFHQVWPWLRGRSPDGLEWRADVGCDPDHGFDGVMKGRITIEQLVDYVRSVEPSCGDCNRFECVCVKSEAVPEAEVVYARL